MIVMTKNTLSSINIFLITENDVYIQNKVNGSYFLNTFLGKKCIKLETYCDILSQVNSDIFARYNNGKGLLLKENQVHEFTFDFCFFTDYQINKAIIFKGNIFNRDFGYIDLTDFSVHFSNGNFNAQLIIGNYFLEKKNNTVRIYSGLVPLWEYDFLYPKYLDLQERLVSPKIEKFIGIYEQQLWILFSNNRFVVLDVESGKELFQIEDLKTTLNVEGLKVGEVFMDHAREKLLILAFKYYIEIDLKTRKCSIVKILEQDGWYIGKGTYYEGDNNIYFCGRRSDIKFHSIGNTSAGIFNTETYEVEWHYTLEREEKNYFFVDVPQANNKYFGVKDCENTLFLFER